MGGAKGNSLPGNTEVSLTSGIQVSWEFAWESELFVETLLPGSHILCNLLICAAPRTVPCQHEHDSVPATGHEFALEDATSSDKTHQLLKVPADLSCSMLFLAGDWHLHGGTESGAKAAQDATHLTQVECVVVSLPAV